MKPAELLEIRKRTILELTYELAEIKAENKQLMAETESLKNARQNLVDRIVDLIREKGDRS